MRNSGRRKNQEREIGARKKTREKEAETNKDDLLNSGGGGFDFVMYAAVSGV